MGSPLGGSVYIGPGFGYWGPGWGPYYGWGYPGPYYYPGTIVAAPAEAPTYVYRGDDGDPVQTAPAAPQQGGYYWYHCASPDGYYPYIKACPGGWQKVTPTPPTQ